MKDKSIIQCIMTNSSCYKNNKRDSLKRINGIVISFTRRSSHKINRFVQPSLNDANYNNIKKIIGNDRVVQDLNSRDYSEGYHIWIGEDIKNNVISVQTLPFNRISWIGNKDDSRNRTSLSIEVLDSYSATIFYYKKAYQELCETLAFLCKEFKFEPIFNKNLFIKDNLPKWVSKTLKKSITSMEEDIKEIMESK